MSKQIAFAGLACLFIVAFAAPAQAQIGYGSAVAVGDGEVFVGESGNQVTSGFVYVYRPGSGGWGETSRIAAPDAAEADGFGRAIATSGTILMVGASAADHGVVHVYQRLDSGWMVTGRITPAEELAGFGSVLAMSGDLVIVGSPAATDEAGAAFIYARQGDSWVRQAKLTGDPPAMLGGSAETAASEPGDRADPTMPERYGAAVAIDGDWALVGAPSAASRFAGLTGIGGGALPGSVYAYHRQGDAWEQVARITPETATPGSAFGIALALRDGEALIGAPRANSGSGGVHVYTYDAEAEQWTPGTTLLPFDATQGIAFGSTVALCDREVYVGAPGVDDRRGVVYHVTRDADGNWTDVTKYGTNGLGRGASFASALAARGDTLVVGIPGDDYGAGTAMILSRALGGWDRSRVLSDIRGLDPITGVAVPCRNGKADRFPCQEVDLLSFLPVGALGGGRGVRTNDIWGWTDTETGREYALVGLTDRASFVDVTDPVNPTFVGSLLRTDGSPGSSWRDIKVSGNHAFIVSDAAAEHGVQILDLTRLREFDGTPITFTEDAHYDRIHSAHNIVMNEETAVAFVVGASGGGDTCGGGLHMINVEDPRDPVFEGCFADTATGRANSGYSHDAQCVTYAGPDRRFEGHEICFGYNGTAVSIADVSDKRNPVAVAVATYPNYAYSHQGWLTEDHRYVYMNDELDEVSGLTEGTRTMIFDVQELDDPILVGEYVSDNKAIDHNLFVRGGRMYQSNYDSGLRVFDISDPENPQPVGYLDTVPWGEDGSGMSGSWGNYPFFESGAVAVTSGRQGLFLVRVRGEEGQK